MDFSCVLCSGWLLLEGELTSPGKCVRILQNLLIKSSVIVERWNVAGLLPIYFAISLVHLSGVGGSSMC